jgi:hypothetical protein
MSYWMRSTSIKSLPSRSMVEKSCHRSSADSAMPPDQGFPIVARVVRCPVLNSKKSIEVFDAESPTARK